jgi:hypothetical protein
MPLWGHENYWLVGLLFQRGLALLYLIAFLVAARQFRPLAGERGLLPLEEYVTRRSFTERPSLFYLFDSDRAIGIAAWTGVALSLFALVGGPSLLPRDLSLLAAVVVWGLLWVLYLSFVNAGQTFYGFGWESMLLETGFLAVFLGPATIAAPWVIVWLLRWVLFRNMFGAGLIKLRGDDCWRDLTCLQYHYETQPMPNPVSWLAHHLPARFHRFGVVVNHVVEVVVPFLYFAPQPIAAIAGAITIGFQAWLLLTGNFAWLNALTIVLALSTFSDSVLTTVLPVTTPSVAPTGSSLEGVVLIVAAVVLLLSGRPVRNMLSPGQVMNTAFDALHLVNTYGAFGSITRDRYELVVQGTADDMVTDATTWETYEFPGKPTDPSARPPQVAPYHYRLDWQLWFAAMSPTPQRHPWVVHLVAKLLDGDAAITSLLERDPFPEAPPSHVRILRYRYRFTDPDERRERGRWWARERVGTYLGPVARDDPRLRQRLRQCGWDDRFDRTSDPEQ